MNTYLLITSIVIFLCILLNRVSNRGAAYFDTWQWFNLSNWLCYVVTSFSYVLLRLKGYTNPGQAAPIDDFEME